MQIYLIYASTSGNVEVCMEFVAKMLKKSGKKVALLRSEITQIETIKRHQKFVFGTSTWEHGLLNPFFENLWQEMQKESFVEKQAAFIGLGDKRYEPVLFCEGIEKIKRLWLKKGGQEIGTTLKIQGEPYDQLNSKVAPWASFLAEAWG